MTSANVTNYRIEKNGVEVYDHSQHHYCHTRWHRLFKFVPFTEHTITPHGLDEEEAYWEGKTVNLSEFMGTMKFSIGDVKRFVEHSEKQKLILEEWVEKFGKQDPELTLRTKNSISHSPL
jgi:hypothetical protein